MGKRCELRGKRGMTLVEVVCAVALLAIVSVAIITSVGFSRISVTTNNTRDKASARCQDSLDIVAAVLEGYPALSKPQGDEIAAGFGKDAEGAPLAIYSPLWPPVNPQNTFYFTATAASDEDMLFFYNVKGRLYYMGGSVELTALANSGGATT